jgi:hypothetical protein
MIKNNIITYAATLGGVLLVSVGLLGFCFPDFLGLHLSAVTNLVHLTSGVLALYFGLKATSPAAARFFCMGIGLLYSLAGLVGFVMGGVGDPLVHVTVGVGFVAAALIQPLRSTIYAPR